MVEDIEASAKAIEKAGGKIMILKTAVSTVGWFAYFTDPELNIHGIWKEGKNAK